MHSMRELNMQISSREKISILEFAKNMLEYFY